MRSLSTDIVERARGGAPDAIEEFQVVGDIMRDSPLRPRVRAAFYTILSRPPGIEFGGRVTDPLGSSTHTPPSS